MATAVTMPALGESVAEGTVTTWLKSVGDKVEADEALLEVATDKVDSEVPSPVSGYLVEIRVQEDETVAVGTVLAVIADQVSAPSAAVMFWPPSKVVRWLARLIATTSVSSSAAAQRYSASNSCGFSAGASPSWYCAFCCKRWFRAARRRCKSARSIRASASFMAFRIMARSAL